MTNGTNVTVDIMRVNGRRVNAMLFRQLYEEKPYNSEFDLLYPINGKVLQKDEFVIFNTPNGLRKFNINQFKSRRTANSLASNLFSVFHDDCSTPELAHMRIEINSYYLNLLFLAEEDSYERQLLAPMIHGDAEEGKHERESSYEGLLSLLNGDFKERIELEYKNAVARLEKRNLLVDIFNRTPQIFL